MKRSESIIKITEAMVNFQKTVTTLKRNAENPFLKKNYTDLAETLETVRKPLTDNGLAIFGDLTITGSDVVFTALLSHISGEWFESVIAMHAESALPQKLGSTITYARRYLISTMLNLASEDDDGSAGAGDKKASNENGNKVDMPKSTTGTKPATTATPATSEAAAPASTSAGQAPKQTPPPSQGGNGSGKSNAAQQKAIHTVCGELDKLLGTPKEKGRLMQVYRDFGVTSTTEIPYKDAGGIINAINKELTAAKAEAANAQ